MGPPLDSGGECEDVNPTVHMMDMMMSEGGLTCMMAKPKVMTAMGFIAVWSASLQNTQ